jgi:hypothetical protein
MIPRLPMSENRWTRLSAGKLYAQLAVPPATSEAPQAARLPLPPAARRTRASAGSLYRAIASSSNGVSQ